MKENLPAKLLDLINAEKDNYAQAIKENRRLEEVKSLYLKIKKLEKDARVLPTLEIAAGYSLTDEINFEKLKQKFINKTEEYNAVLSHLTLEDLLDVTKFNKLASLRQQTVSASASLSDFILTTIQRLHFKQNQK